jgi:hypothetical protein
MAQRFGGKHSPGAGAADRPQAVIRPHPVGARANMMFLPAIPMVFLGLNDGAIGMVAALLAAGLLTLGAWLLRGGLQAEAAFDARKVARRPALPRKLLAAGLTGLGIALAAWRNEPGLVAPILYGAAAFGLHIAAFGMDPLKNKGMEGIDTFQQDRVAKVVDEAETYLTAMTDALKRASDRASQDRLKQFQATARTLIRTVEEDPRDLTAARRYLGVYLMGARDATVKFADIYARTQSAEAKRDYLALLDDLDQNFNAKTAKMLLDDRSDLAIEIEVLQDRLTREGVRLD